MLDDDDSVVDDEDDTNTLMAKRKEKKFDEHHIIKKNEITYSAVICFTDLENIFDLKRNKIKEKKEEATYSL